ncbi:hypothetical protein B7486_28345 [cyanobacterium TDX16]|nr:hypothetical protein B7486_28345 [cyanobacterium TDX16]
MWGNSAIAISLDFRALFCYGDYFIVIDDLASAIGINLNNYINEMYLQISPVSGRWCVRLGLFGAIAFGSAVALGSTALAQVPPDSQIVPDSTLGADNSIVNSSPNGLDTISGGARREGNLFHSFERFSIPDGRAALFNNGADIQNILTRVTGGSVSDIDGILAARGTANLFLLNPNGIIFGENASLRVGGSFIATTASSINFADGTQFSATPGTGAPLLTVSVPLGLQFGAGAGNIINRANDEGLQVGAGKTLGLVGGNVNLEGGRLTARGGRIELGAVAAPGIVEINPDPSGVRFSFPTDLTLGDILLTADPSVSPPRPAVVDTRAGGGGSIAVNARNLNLFGGSELLAGILQNRGSADAVAGDIDINVKDAIAIDSLGINDFRSGIFNNVETGSTGKGGNINIKTGSLRLSNGAVLVANTQGQGDAGSIQITATNPDDSVVFESGSFIQTDSFSQSSAGNVTITADGQVSFTGTGSEGFSSGVFSRAVTSEGLGKGGSITIQARSLSLTQRAQINTSTSGQGDSGNVTITANEGVFLDNNGRIFSQVGATGAGKGGDITIQARSLSLAEGAQINTSTSGRGNAGNIELSAAAPTDSIVIGGGSFIESSSSGTGNAGSVTISADGNVTFDGQGIFSNLLQIQADSTGQPTQVPSDRRGGDINIKARSLILINGGTVNASTFSQGNAGNINLVVNDTIRFEGVGEFSNGVFGSGIYSIVSQEGKGRGGDINIKTNFLSLKGGGIINVSTAGQGDGGNVILEIGDTISLDRGSSILSLVQNGGRGEGGNITIKKARSLSLNNESSLISTTSGQGNAGDIQINVTDSISVRDGSGLEADSRSTSNAGNITITAGGHVSFDTVGNERFPTGVFGRLQPIQELQQDNPNGQILQIPSNRRGGDINIKARSLSLTNGAQINTVTFSQGNAGNVKIDVSDIASIDGVGIFENEVDRGVFRSGVFSTVQQGGRGKGGNINIKASTLALTNSGTISASTLDGEGGAGDINITVRSLDLDRGGISATSSSGDGGNIQLQIDKRLTLRNGSEISTTAGTEQQPGDGGKITIESPLIIAALVNEFNEDSDITANAFSGIGGDITINTQGIFGIQPRREESPNTNDITTRSELGIAGTIQINSLEIDPSRDIVELPTGLVDASSLVAAGCPSGAENRFTVAGRGGLPPAPADKLSSDALLTDWATLQTPETQNRAAVATTTPVATNTTPTPSVETITEATSWQYDRNGAIILTSGDTTSPSHLKTTPTSCPSS